MSKKNQIDMLHGPLLRKILLFALPSAITSSLQQLFNATDVAVVGQFAGSEVLAAVGSNGPVINLIVNLLVGTTIGTNVVIANYIGQGRKDRVNDTIHTSILLAIIGGILFGIVGIVAARPMLVLMGSPDNVIDLATLYLRIYFAGTPLMALYNFGAAILRSRGDTTRPMISLIISGIINVGLNLLLVAVFHMGVAGVAIATVTANGISASRIMYVMFKEKGEFRFRPGKLRIHRDHFKRILKIGIPSGVQGMVFSLSNVFIQSGVNSFGSDAIAGSSAALNFEYFAYFVLNAFVQAATTFIGQNYGAGNMQRCRQIFWRCMIMSVLATAACNFGFYLFKGPLIGLFTNEPQVAEWAYIRMRHILLFQTMANSYEISGAAMRGMGHAMTPSAIMIVGTCLFRIFWLFTVFPQVGTFEILVDVYPVSWVITGTAVLIAYFFVRSKEEKAYAQHKLEEWSI